MFLAIIKSNNSNFELCFWIWCNTLKLTVCKKKKKMLGLRKKYVIINFAKNELINF